MKRIVIGVVVAAAALFPKIHLRAQGSLDMQSFFVGASNTFPRTGTHPMNQVISNNALYWVKFENYHSFEVYYADSSGNIRFWEDGSSVSTPYIFSDTLWLNHYMSVNDEIDHPDNTITYGNSSCEVTGSGAFGYKTKLEAYWPSYDTGTDLGTRDVILVDYTPYNNHQYFERFYYASGAGWASWEQWDNGSLQQYATFATFGGANTQPGGPCRGTPPSS